MKTVIIKMGKKKKDVCKLINGTFSYIKDMLNEIKKDRKFISQLKKECEKIAGYDETDEETIMIHIIERISDYIKESV